MTKDSKDTNMGELITAMVGRSLESRFPPVDNIPGDPILSIQHLSTKYAPYLQDISFDVREGEILVCMAWWAPDVQSCWKPFSACVPVRQGVCISATT